MDQTVRPRIKRSLIDERGSALVAGLMLVFVMTLLGAALFDLARLEGLLRIDTRTGVQALEIAEAGLERGLHLMYLEFTCGPSSVSPLPISVTNCASPPTNNPNYITDVCPAGGPGCLARLPLTTDCPASVLPDGAVGFKLLKADQTFGGGTYTVCIRPNPSAPTNQLQAQLRSRGELTAVTGTAVRIVQIDATALVNASRRFSPFSTGGPASGAFLGNALIAGSLSLVSCPGAGCKAATFGGGGGMQNNYSGIDAILLNRIPSLFPDGTTVNTLAAVLKVRQGEVDLNSNSACIGKQETGGGCSQGANAGIQDTASGVYTSGTWGGGSHDDCASGLNGQTTTNNRCNVWTAAQGPYPAGDPTSLSLLSDSTIIDGQGYRCFFNPPGSTCPNTTDPIPGGTNFPEYFYTNSWRIDDSQGNAGCDIVGPTGTAADCTTVLIALQTGATPNFGAGPVTTLPITDVACQRQGGPLSATACTLQIAAGGIVGQILDPGTGVSAPIRPDQEPINVYVKRRAAAPAGVPTVQTSGLNPPSDDNMYFRGKLMILADNPAGTTGFNMVNQGLLSDPGINQPWCTQGSYLCGYAYPANHFLGVLTTGNIASAGSRDMVGGFYAANTAQTAKFVVTAGSGGAQFAGTLSAQQYDFTGPSQAPKLYQAPWNTNALPQAFGPGGGAFAAIIASGWRQIQ